MNSSLFVAAPYFGGSVEGISALQKKFVLAEESPSGQNTYQPIKMEKAGLMYDLIKWYVPKSWQTKADYAAN